MSSAFPITVIPRKRRGVELVLVIFALAITLGAYALVDLNVNNRLSPMFPYLAGGCVVLAALAHFAVRWRLPYADPVILPCVILLNGLGLAMIHRIDLISNPPLNGARQQLIWTTLGVIMFILVCVWLRDHRPLQRYTYTIGLAGIVLLLLPLVPGIGTAKFGARIWIHIGPYSFQPAEAAKVLLAIAFAAYLVEKREVLALAGYRILGVDLPRARDLGPILVMWMISLAILVFQNDLGTSLLFFGLFVMMLYVSTERAGWVVLGTLLFAGGAYFAYLNLGHVRIRVSSWLDPFSDYDQNFQVISAQFGMAWGGLLGTGLGLGRPGLTPLARSDFIAAAIGEELGMTGLMAVIIIYGLDRRPRSADRPAMPGAVRKTARHRSVVRLRPPGVHHHRRRHPTAAADRVDHAVHVPRRLVADLQLDRRRSADGDLPPRPQTRRHRLPGQPRHRDDPTREDGEVMGWLARHAPTHLPVSRHSTANEGSESAAGPGFPSLDGKRGSGVALERCGKLATRAGATERRRE